MSYAMAIEIRNNEKYKQYMSQKFPKGIRIFGPKPSAPSFVKGQIIITLNELNEFCKANTDLLSEYQGQKQLKLSILEKKDGSGLNVVIDTYKPKEDVPF